MKESAFLPGQLNTNSKLSFEERAKKFEAALSPLVELWGVTPGAMLNPTPQAITAVPIMQDLWGNKDAKT